MAQRDAIIAAVNGYLGVSRFKDYAPLGLQVEGAPQVRKVVTGVSFGMELLQRAREAGAQMLIVHHGMFWKDESPVLTGAKRRRIAALLEAEMTLAAYHLPLDAHPVVGNNAQLLKLLGATKGPGFGDYHGTTIGFAGSFGRPVAVEQLVRRLARLGSERPLCFPGASGRVRRIGVVSGGAGSMFQQAIDAGLDLFVTGEPWEPAQALAAETGVGFLAAGHYNSEKLGVTALGRWLSRRFDIAVQFIDVPNPA